MRNNRNKPAKTEFKAQKVSTDIDIKGDPTSHNSGDLDLEPFLMPLLKNTDGDIKELDHDALRKALSDGTLLVCGAKLWNALHSNTWRHREAAA